MSADNVVLVLKNRSKTDDYDYRVAHLQAMENLECEDEVEGTDYTLGDLYTVIDFHDSEVFHDVDEAFKCAFDIEGSLDFGCEYGICFRDQSSVFFPSISYEEANRRLEDWWYRVSQPDGEEFAFDLDLDENEEIN